MKGPSTGKPSALSKSRFAGRLAGLVVSVGGRGRDICEIDVASDRIMVPAKHGVDSLLKLGAVRLVDATCVHPKELQTVTPGLISAEPDLVIAEFVLACTILQGFEDDLFGPPELRLIKFIGILLTG